MFVCHHQLSHRHWLVHDQAVAPIYRVGTEGWGITEGRSILSYVACYYGGVPIVTHVLISSCAVLAPPFKFTSVHLRYTFNLGQFCYLGKMGILKLAFGCQIVLAMLIQFYYPFGPYFHSTILHTQIALLTHLLHYKTKEYPDHSDGDPYLWILNKYQHQLHAP